MKLWLLLVSAMLASGGELRFCLHDEPKTTDPLVVADEAAEAVRYLTEGVLIRINRQEQRLLAFGISQHYRSIFEITRLSEAIGIYDTETQALAAIHRT